MCPSRHDIIEKSVCTRNIGLFPEGDTPTYAHFDKQWWDDVSIIALIPSRIKRANPRECTLRRVLLSHVLGDV